MPQKKLFIIDQRMLELMDWAINGEQSFTKEHILKACELTSVTPSWVFGMEPNRFGGKQIELTAIQQLKSGVNLVEQELKNKKK